MKSYSLLEVAKSVQKTLSARYGSSFWVRAEMNKLNHYSQSGHCYPELLEKENGKVIAQMSAILWKTDYTSANRKFIAALGEPLRDGVKILFLAKLTYDPAHGLALQILDIDPSFTVGDLQREKQESIQKLRSEGLFDRNKKLSLPVLPQRLAIISVETSKGYADFLNVLDNNRNGYKFSHFLFPSLLQGEKAVGGIIGQLRNIKKVLRHFDAVAIIRGGGGDVGLSCYNDFNLAKEIATFPIPVLTGIGHATNETVCEMVSHFNSITPTKLADRLLERVHDFAVAVEKITQLVTTSAQRIVTGEKQMMAHEIKLFKSISTSAIDKGANNIANAANRLDASARFRIRRDKDLLTQSSFKIIAQSSGILRSSAASVISLQASCEKASGNQLKNQNMLLQGISNHLDALRPENILKRGFSITMADGKPVRNASDLRIGQNITTVLFEGSLEGEITKIINP